MGGWWVIYEYLQGDGRVRVLRRKFWDGGLGGVGYCSVMGEGWDGGYGMGFALGVGCFESREVGSVLVGYDSGGNIVGWN